MAGGGTLAHFQVSPFSKDPSLQSEVAAWRVQLWARAQGSPEATAAAQSAYDVWVRERLRPFRFPAVVSQISEPSLLFL